MVSRQSTLAGLVLPVGLSLACSVGPAQMACHNIQPPQQALSPDRAQGALHVGAGGAGEAAQEVPGSIVSCCKAG